MTPREPTTALPSWVAFLSAGLCFVAAGYLAMVISVVVVSLGILPAIFLRERFKDVAAEDGETETTVYVGARMVDVGQRCGARVHPIEVEWGSTVEP